MVRVGRKRKEGPRHPGGQLVREDDVTAVGYWARSREVFKEVVGDHRWGSELGRLHYLGKIVDLQRTAGEKWHNLVMQHRRICLDSPSESPKTSEMQPRIPSSSHADTPDEIVEQVQDKYDRIFTGIIDMGRDGVKVMKVLKSVIMDDEPQTYQDLMLLKRGLDRLVVLFHLTSVSKLR